MLFSVSARLRVASLNSFAIGLEQRRAAIDREISAFGIDDDTLAELPRRIDDIAYDARRQHALGVIGQQNDIRAQQQRQNRLDQLLFDGFGGGRRHFPIGAQHVRGEMLGYKTHFARSRSRGIAH